MKRKNVNCPLGEHSQPKVLGSNHMPPFPIREPLLCSHKERGLPGLMIEMLFLM